MAKWADYLISQVSYDQDHIITKIMQHHDIGNKISSGEIVDRNVIATNLGHGAKYMTVFGDLGKIRMGKNVRYYRAYESHYIRIDDNKVMSDNLGQIPELDGTNQEEKPALTETKPKPVTETKPLSAMSSAFFSEQVEELEPAKVEAEVAPEPAKVEAEVAPEPAKVEAEVAPEPGKKKVVRTKSSAKKKPTKKKASAKKKPTKKKASTKKKSTKKKSTKKKASTKKKSTKKKPTKKKPTKKKRA